MTPNPSMTGSFKTKLPAELLAALEHTPVEDPSRDMDLQSMKPSFMERVLALVSGSRRRRR